MSYYAVNTVREVPYDQIKCVVLFKDTGHLDVYNHQGKHRGYCPGEKGADPVPQYVLDYMNDPRCVVHKYRFADEYQIPCR